MARFNVTLECDTTRGRAYSAGEWEIEEMKRSSGGIEELQNRREEAVGD